MFSPSFAMLDMWSRLALCLDLRTAQFPRSSSSFSSSQPCLPVRSFSSFSFSLPLPLLLFFPLLYIYQHSLALNNNLSISIIGEKSHQRLMKVAPRYKLFTVYTAYTLTQFTHTLCNWRRGKTNIGPGSDKNGHVLSHEQRERYATKVLFSTEIPKRIPRS